VCHHLTGISGGASASFVYDSFGRRMSKTINSLRFTTSVQGVVADPRRRASLIDFNKAAARLRSRVGEVFLAAPSARRSSFREREPVVNFERDIVTFQVQLAAEHLVGVHRVEIFAHGLDLAVAHHTQEVVAVLIGLAVFHLRVRFGLGSDPITLGGHGGHLDG